MNVHASACIFAADSGSRRFLAPHWLSHHSFARAALRPVRRYALGLVGERERAHGMDSEGGSRTMQSPDQKQLSSGNDAREKLDIMPGTDARVCCSKLPCSLRCSLPDGSIDLCCPATVALVIDVYIHFQTNRKIKRGEVKDTIANSVNEFNRNHAKKVHIKPIPPAAICCRRRR